MRIKKGLIFIICIILNAVVIYFLVQPERSTYQFSPQTSLAFFGTEPEEFLNTYYDYYDLCEDFRKHAEINEKGDLILRLTHEQEEVYLQYYDSQLEDLSKTRGVKVSEDYQLLLITGNRDEVTQIIANHMSFFTVFDMANQQLIINKVNPEEIVVEIRVVDENTGKIVYNAIWPKESVTLATKQWDFSQ